MLKWLSLSIISWLNNDLVFWFLFSQPIKLLLTNGKRVKSFMIVFSYHVISSVRPCVLCKCKLQPDRRTTKFSALRVWVYILVLCCPLHPKAHLFRFLAQVPRVRRAPTKLFIWLFGVCQVLSELPACAG